MRKLGHTVAATTIRSVLLQVGIPPSGRRAKLSWKQFLAAQAQTLVVADFLSVDTVFFKRLKGGKSRPGSSTPRRALP